MIGTMFTGKDNSSLDVGRVLWFSVTFALIVFEGHAVIVQHAAFDPIQFATGAAAVLAAGGLGIAVKSSTEPGMPPKVERPSE